MNKIQVFILSIFMLSSFTSCNKQQPQLPSNKGNFADKNIAVLLDINKNLATKEDSILKSFVKGDTSYKRNALGFWYKIDKKTNGDFIKNKKGCNFSYKLLLINGKVLQEDDKKIIFGKKQLVSGLEEGLKLLHQGEKATFIIPWYLGYGMKGMEPIVPPYTSLIYQIKLTD